MRRLPRLTIACIATFAIASGPLPTSRGPVNAPREYRSADEPLPIDSTTQTNDVGFRKDSHDRMTVGVTVAGRGPYRFLVDTGSEQTVVSRELASGLKLADRDTVRVHGVLGASLVGRVDVPSLDFAAKRLTDVAAPVLDAADLGADGLLGIDSLRGARVLLDFKNKRLSVTPAKSRDVRYDGDAIVVRAKLRQGRLVLTRADIDGIPVAVVIDTGAEVSIGNKALLDRLQQRRKRGFAHETSSITTVTGDTGNISIGFINRLSIGGVGIEGLATGFVDAHAFNVLGLGDEPAMLLGMNALRSFEQVSIDFERKRVRFVLPRHSGMDTVRMAMAGR